MASEGDNRIKVAIRVRRLNSKEKARNKSVQWKLSENKLWQVDPKTEQKIGQIYTFDHVFGMSAQSKEIYEALAKPIIESCLQGFNGTIFAYGQTSSGKTYTMMGEKEEEGIIPLSVNHIFKVVESIPTREFLIRVAYMEIYNEQIHDLLELKNNNLKIHEDSSGQAYVTLKEEIADTPEKVIAVMKKGEKMRRFGVTDINERSSRSHTIFRIVIESRKKQINEILDEYGVDDAVQISVLNLVDLAGSERVMQTKATGDRFKEGCAINKSLFYLGNVISQLSEGSGQYVNFRDSKLTRILRTSLGGNAHTAIICTITPASIEETISTLSFASRAICIKNEPHVNEIISDESLMRGHAAMVKKLEMELEKARREIDSSSMKRELEQKEKIISRLKGWIQRDMVQVNSPQNLARSQRRKTWAASDFKKMANIFNTFKQKSIEEEPKDSGFAMETDSGSRDSVFMEESTAAIPASCHVTYRRGSHAGRCYSDFPDSQHRFSWYSPPSEYEERYSSEFEALAKRRRLEIDEESDDIAECRKSLQEAILRLHGNDIDLQPYSLIELITELTNLAEEKKPVVIGQEPSLVEQSKVSFLEELLEKAKYEHEALKTEKDEIESLLKSEKDKFMNAENQLREALKKVEVLSNQTNRQILSYEENSGSSTVVEASTDKFVHSEEENFNFPLTEECDVKELKREIEFKDLLLTKLQAREEELNSLLSEERSKRMEVELQLQKKVFVDGNIVVEEENLNIASITKEESELNDKSKEIFITNTQNPELLENLAAEFQDTSTKYTEKLANLEQKLVELQSILNKTLEENSKLSKEKEALELLFNSSEEKYEKCFKLEEDSMKYIDDSEVDKSYSQECISLQCQLNEKDQELEQLSCQLKEKEVEVESLRFGFERLNAELTEEKKKNVEMDRERESDSANHLDKESCHFSDVVAGYEQKISQLEAYLLKNCSAMDKIVIEKEEFESLFSSGKEKYRILRVQLDEALNNLGSSSEKISEYEEKIAELQENLANNLLELSNITLEKEEFRSLFMSGKDKYKALSRKLSETLSSLECSQKKLEHAEVLSEMIIRLEDELKSKDTDLDSMHTKLMAIHAELHEERALKAELEQKLIDERNSVLHGRNQEIEGLLVKISAQENAIAELQEDRLQKEELQSKMSSLEKLAEDCEFLLKEERKNSESLKEEINHLQSELISLKGNEDQHQQIEDLLAKVAAQDTQITELEVSKLEKEELKSRMFTLEKLTEDYENLLEEERKKSESLMEDIKQIQHELKNIKDERDMLLTYQHDDDVISKEIESLKSSFENCKSELLNAESERDELLSDLASKVQLNDQLQDQLRDVQSNVELLSKKLADSMSECENFKEKEAELSSLRAELEQAKFSLEFYAQSEEELDNLLTVEKNKVKDLQNQLNTLKEENERLTYSREAEETPNEEIKILQISIDKYKAELSSITLERNDLISSLDLIKSQNLALENHLMNAKSDIDSLSRKLAEVESQYESVKNRDSELESLKAELENVKLKVHEKSEDDLDNLLSIEKAKVSDLLIELSEASTLKNDLLNEKIKLTESLEKAEKELTSLVDEHIKCTENEIKMIELEEALKEANKNIENLKNEKELVLESERKKSEKMLSEKEECINSLLEENKNMSRVNEEKLSSLEKIIETEIAKCKEKTEEINSMTVDKNLLEELLKVEKDKVSALERQIRMEEEKLQNLKVAFDEQVQKFQILELDFQRKLSQESSKKEELENKNIELTWSMEKVERQFNLLNENHSSLLEKNVKLCTANDELSAEVDILQVKLSSSKLEVERLEASLNAKQDLLTNIEKEKEEIFSLHLTSSRKVSTLEREIKEIKYDLLVKTNELNDGAQKIAELQSALEEAQDQIAAKAKEISQLEEALKNSEKKLKGIDEDGIQMEQNQTVINEMEKQLAILKEERKAEVESYEEKLSTLERLLSIENEKCTLKTNEMHVLQMNKGRLEEMLQAEKDRVSELENQIVKGEEKLAFVKDEIEEHRIENERLKALEIDLNSKLELEKQKNVITENELGKLKAALSSSEINLNQLKCEVAYLNRRLTEETSKVSQLKVELETEKKACLSAKEAEQRALSVFSAQETAKSVLSSNENVSHLESKMECVADGEKDKQIKELMEKLEDQEKYIQSFDRAVEKMERRYNLTLNHRLEIQKKAKERETELLNKISELEEKIGKVPKTEEGKPSMLELEKEIQHARSKIEETEKKLQVALTEAKTYHTQANDYKREILHCKQLLHAGVTRTEAKVDSSVQTIPVEVPVVEDVRPSGSGVVQYFKIDCLEKKVKSLEKEKKFLMDLCRRRHDQREELKLKLEALTGKRDVFAPSNKENVSKNV